MIIKKNLKIIIFCFALCSCSDNYLNNNDWNKDNLKGKVKSTKITAFLATEKFGNVLKGDRVVKHITYPDHLIEYNNDGNKVLEVYYDELLEGEMTTFKYEYLFNNRKFSLNFYNKFGELYAKWVYLLDNENFPIEKIGYDSLGAVIDKELYHYSRNHKLAESLIFDSLGDFQIRITYKYNTDEKLIKVSQYNSDSTSLGFYNYSYNNNGDISDELIYNNDGTLNSHWKYKYKNDKKGNWFEKVYYKNDQIIKVEERDIEYY